MPRMNKTGTTGLFSDADGVLRVDLRFWNKKLGKHDRFRKTFKAGTSLTAARRSVVALQVEIERASALARIDPGVLAKSDPPRRDAVVLKGAG